MAPLTEKYREQKAAPQEVFSTSCNNIQWTDTCGSYYDCIIANLTFQALIEVAAEGRLLTYTYAW